MWNTIEKSGSGEFWKGQFYAEQTLSIAEETTLTFEYLGDELDVHELELIAESEARNKEYNFESLETDVLQSSVNCTLCATTPEDNEFEVSIQWKDSQGEEYEEYFLID